jgi:hypothetical protein
MHLSAKQLDIASRIDAKVQRLASEGDDDVAIFVELADDMPAFRRLLDAGPHAMDQLCLRFGGFYRYAKILEAVRGRYWGVSTIFEKSYAKEPPQGCLSAEMGSPLQIPSLIPYFRADFEQRIDRTMLPCRDH